MKLAVIGGGGVRSMFLAKSLAQRAGELGIDTLCFMDNDETKLNIYGKMAQHTARIINPDISFLLTSDAKQAVTNADYVITTIREGGDEMRVKDERIALDLGVLGQETTGAAGFSFAIRSVNVLAEYCELIKKYAKPDCKVFNFTNPAGVVSQTLRDMGYGFTYGICDAPSGMLNSFAKLYGSKEGSVKGEVYGLNHLSYFKSITLDGREIMPELIENDEAYEKTDMRYFEKDLLRERKCILNEYLYYFYYREKALSNILNAERTRGEQILEINKNMTAELMKTDIDNDFETALGIFEKWYGIRENNYMASETGVKRDTPWKFDINAKDSGGYAGVALKFIEIRNSKKTDSMILCVPNNGAINELEDGDVVEITCDIDENGVTPHRFDGLDAQNLEIIRRVKIYERLASKAIREKSVQAAVEALTLHPLVNSYSVAKELVKNYLKLNEDYTEGWE
ncbi:MAG: 6-phospho-beta-glucosidase [Ruminococcaceae bacterium]|nr:6-phospho-beta-glucosidase [Oscillospiraceae bacterium]